MKLSAISIAVVLAGVVGVASAAGQNEVMHPITVSGRAVTACTPPDDTVAGHVCDGFDQLVRANFTPRQIGMLFGDSTSYPESLTGGVELLRKRYQVLLQQYLAAQQKPAVNATSVAAK